MDKTEELIEKEARLWRFLDERALDGILISKRSNFAWITGGGDNRIFMSSEEGASSALITREGKYLLAHWMDGDRVMAEEIQGLGYELKKYPWFEGRQPTLDELTKGKRIGSDLPWPGLEFVGANWYDLYFPLTQAEADRAREVGKMADEAIREACYAAKPGDTELEVASLLAQAYTKRGFTMSVLIVGSDERVFQYRHCLPTEKVVREHLLLHVAGQKYGLHANLTRLVHFGPIPEDLRHRHQAMSYVHSTLLANLMPGGRFVDLFEKIKTAYRDTGYDGEWQGHVQGGPTAYDICSPMVLLDPQAVVPTCQTYGWLMTVPGIKIEELSLVTENGGELLSFGPGWPELCFELNGKTYRTPDILER